MVGRSIAGMHKHGRSIVSVLARRFRSRAVLDWRTSPSVTNCTFFVAGDEVGHLLWVWLYRIWPRCLKAMELVKPSTVIQWQRQGFRLFWRWRSRSGRPSVDREIRQLIREMSSANSLWGAPRIHGELLKLGIEISQATVAKYMVPRPGTPSQTWRTFLRNQAEGIAAIDMFVVASASFRLLYVMVITGPRSQENHSHGRRRASHRGLVIASGHRSVPLEHCSAIPAARPRCLV